MSEHRIDRGSATLTYRVTEMLRREIVRGERPSGGRLNEALIATEYDVSRGPVRDAIRRLASDGLVVIEPHRGAFVKRLDRQDIEELFELRVALETEAVALAAARMTDEGLEQLRHLQAQSVSEVSEQDDHAFPALIDLHELIAALAGNHRISAMLSHVNVELHLMRSRSGSTASRAAQALHEHDEIIERLAARDPEGARSSMRMHLFGALENTLTLMCSA